VDQLGNRLAADAAHRLVTIRYARERA
jgi:hypothetical protein